MQNCEEFTPDVKVTDFNFFIMHNFFVNFTERNVKKKKKKKKRKKRKKEKTGQILHFREKNQN